MLSVKKCSLIRPPNAATFAYGRAGQPCPAVLSAAQAVRPYLFEIPMHELIVMICIFAALFSLGGCISLKRPKPAMNPVAEQLLREGYPCLRVDAPLKMDGRLGDPAWAKAPVLNFYKPPKFETPQYQTEARVLYDRDYVYIGFKAWDQDIWSYYTNRDDSTFREDCLEFFFRTDPAKEAYYNLEINALGTIYDAYDLSGLKRKWGGGEYRWRHWDGEHIKVKTGMNGTLNNPNDEDQYWTLEMAVPFADLPSLNGQHPRPGDIWLFHLARCEYSVYYTTNYMEASSCAPLPKVDFHLNRNWLKLNFK